MRTNRSGRFLAQIAALAVAWMCIFPFLVMLSTALKPDSELNGQQRWVPIDPNWSVFGDVWSGGQLISAMVSSLLIAIGVTTVTLLLGIPAAYVLARHHFRGRDLVMSGILITQLLSPVVVIVPLFEMAEKVGLLGTYFGVIVASSAFVLPFSIWLLAGFFGGVSRELEEAAALDACGRLRTLTSVILPLSIPGVAATGVYAFLFGWNEFVISLTFLASTPEKWPVTVAIFSNVGAFQVDWQGLMAVALLSSVPVIVLFGLVQKYLDRGFASLTRV